MDPERVERGWRLRFLVDLGCIHRKIFFGSLFRLFHFFFS
jgi:hypothetical protein